MGPFAGNGLTYEVFSRGTGPGVVVIPEVPGISPEVLGFGDHLVENGFTVANALTVRRALLGLKFSNDRALSPGASTTSRAPLATPSR